MAEKSAINQAAEDFFKSLEEKGEDLVRTNLAAGVFAGKKKPLVDEWLRRKDQDRSNELSSLSIDSNREQIRIARSAKNAAWAAAIAAIVAAIAAIIAIRFSN